MAEAIYLDNNATTPILPEVAEAMREAALRYGANPASQHRAGQMARRVLEEARQRIAELLGAKTSGMDADILIFTSGGTEANNLAIRGMLAAAEPGHLVTSAIEHPSLLGPVADLERQGWQVTRVGAQQNGSVSVEEIRRAIRDNTRLVSLMAANNETGVVQPFKEVGHLCAELGLPFHVDAAQWVGKEPTLFADWRLASLSFTAHKFNGPLGIGGLLVRQGTALVPQLAGGHQQSGMRPGTESVALAVGMQTALEIATRNLDKFALSMNQLREEFESLITTAIPETVVIGREARRLPHVSNIALPGVDRQAMFLALDMAGIACSTGSACASGSSEPSPVLLAMGLDRALVEGALRFSFGSTNTLHVASEAAHRIINAYNHLRR